MSTGHEHFHSEFRIQRHLNNTRLLLGTIVTRFEEGDFQGAVDSLACMKMRLNDHIALINIHKDTFK